MKEDEVDHVSNAALIQSTKDIHGRLYHRINSLQVQINRLREENKQLKKNESYFDYNPDRGLICPWCKYTPINDCSHNPFKLMDENKVLKLLNKKLRETFEHALEHLK